MQETLESFVFGVEDGGREERLLAGAAFLVRWVPEITFTGRLTSKPQVRKSQRAITPSLPAVARISTKRSDSINLRYGCFQV